MNIEVHTERIAAQREWAEGWIEQIEQVISGKRDVIKQLVMACLCEGHVLLEDKPGVGKTTLVQALSSAASCSFSRIQFTPDQLPGDIVGMAAIRPQTMELYYRPGPLHAQIVLADEINRASPKTQSALLEAMEERAVTVDGCTYPLPRPFMLLATQNPLRHEGTYPLPEAQLDRFLFRLSIGYPQREQEVEMLQRAQLEHPLKQVQSVISIEMLQVMQAAVRAVYVDSVIRRYIVMLAEATRTHPEVELGLSPRASIALMRASQASAWMAGRDYVIPDDVKAIFSPVVLHRILLRTTLRHNQSYGDKETILSVILRSTPIPSLGRLEDVSQARLKLGGGVR
jgi:MoxR-like ATPase